MPQNVIIVGSAFQIASAVQGPDNLTFVLSFTQPPTAISSTGANDALNPNNYVITGPSSTAVLSVTKVTSYIFNLTLTYPIVTGDYVLTVNNVQSSGVGLSGGNQVTVVCTVISGGESLVQGHSNDDAGNILRRFLPPQYRFKLAWEALIAGLAAGDQIVKTNIFDAFSQLFISSAAGNFLVQRAADKGIDYPSAVGMPDDSFRELVIDVTNQKLVHQALLKILGIFYGDKSVRANILSGVSEPYNITPNDTISFLFDGRNTLTVTFFASDFSNIASATASEVAAVLTRAFKRAGLSAYALSDTVDGLNKVYVYSGAQGLLGSVSVTGGMAQNALQFPTRIPLFTGATNTQWLAQRLSSSEFRFTYNSGATTSPVTGLLSVKVGDYVLLDFVNASTLRGWYQVSDVHIDANTTTGSYVNNTWFSITPTLGFPYSVGGSVTINQTGPNEVIFYRPTIYTVIQNSAPSFVAQYQPQNLDVIMPVTTKVVTRAAQYAAYLHVQSTVVITSVSRTSNVVTVTTTTPHGYSTGQMVEIRGVTGSTAGRWDILGQITNTGANTFTIPGIGSNGTGIGGEAIAVTAPAGNASIIGPYILDPNAGFAITGTSTTTGSIISGGRGINTLTVTSASSFPTTQCWLVFGFGTKYETGPVRCLGRLNSTTLIIDQSYVFPLDLAAGTDVTLLAQKGAFNPTPGSLNLFYVTDSNSGRIAAQDLVGKTAGAGININYKIVYPGDRGLGGQGNPITGIKISDVVQIWAGDNVDATIAGAHNA